MILKNKILLVCSLVFISCKSFSIRNPFQPKIKNSFFNYHSKNFECFSKQGVRDSDIFNLYLLKWNELKDSYKQQNLVKKKADIVIVGNSLIHLFEPKLLEKEFPNVDIVARGIGGDTTELLDLRLSETVFNLNPKTIIIEIGGNDLIYGKCLSTIQANTKKIINTIREYNKNTKIIFISLPPTLSPELNSIVPSHNSFLQKLSKEENFSFIDIWNEMRDENLPILKEEFRRPMDGIHFNEKGYEVIGKQLRPLLLSK
jgi:lysophospholipase L1-like esterase